VAAVTTAARTSLAIAIGAGPAFATSNPSHATTDHRTFAGPLHADWRGAGRPSQLHGVVTSVDPASLRIDNAGLPFWELAWRRYTHNSAVDPGIDLTTLKPRTRVDFWLSHFADSIYYIGRLKVRTDTPD